MLHVSRPLMTEEHFVRLQFAGYATQRQCARPGGADAANPLTLMDQCVAEQYYVRNSIARSLIYNHVGNPSTCNSD